MKFKYSLISLLMFTSISSAQNLTNKVNEYFQAQKQVEHKHATESDVDKLLSLLTDNATFEHPSFNAIQSKEEYKKGLLYYLAKYGKCDIKVINTIMGLNVIVVEYLHPCTDQAGTAFEDSEEKLVTLFEFKDNKIKRIRHYF